MISIMRGQFIAELVDSKSKSGYNVIAYKTQDSPHVSSMQAASDQRERVSFQMGIPNSNMGRVFAHPYALSVILISSSMHTAETQAVING